MGDAMTREKALEVLELGSSIADARAQTRDDARSTGAFATPDRSPRRPRTAIEGANSARVRIRDAPS